MDLVLVLALALGAGAQRCALRVESEGGMHLLQRGAGALPAGKDFFDFQSILADNPQGSFLSGMEVLVRANSMAYNTTQPLFDPESDRLDGFDAGGRRWQRLRRFDRDPAPGGVFARVFTSGRSAVVAFKGICQPGGEQCIIDTCFLAKIQAYGALSKDLSRAFGAEDETCRRFAHLLNFEDQADRLVREVQQGLPGFSITLTGHSMGGMLAIVTAARQPKVLKALTFAPTPFHQALIQDLNWTEDQIQGLNADDLVATCDPFDCGVNSLYVEQARSGSKTCLYLDSTEPGPCQNMPVPYQNGGWRESLGSGSDDMLRALPNLLCKTGAHDWARYEKLVLAQTGAGAPANVPVCSTDFSVLQKLQHS